MDAIENAKMQLLVGVFKWVLCLIILALSPMVFLITPKDWWLNEIAMVYLACGIYLNRVVLRNIIWHPVYNTLDNVVISKLLHIVFWPFLYAILFLKLAINRVI